MAERREELLRPEESSRLSDVRALMFLVGRGGTRLVTCLIAVHVTSGLSSIVFVVATGVLLTGIGTNNDGLVISGMGLLGGTILLQQLLAPFQLALSARVAIRVDSYCSLRLATSALAATSLGDLESPEAVRAMADARQGLDDMVMTPGTATEGALALVARYSQLLGAVVVIAWLVGPLLSGAALVLAVMNRFGQTRAFSAWSAIYRSLAAPRTKLSYFRGLATGVAPARDIRALQIQKWIVAGYLTAANTYLAELWKQRRKTVAGIQFMVLILVSLVGAAFMLAICFGRGSSDPESIATTSMLVQLLIICIAFGVVFPEADPKLQYGLDSWKSILGFERIASESPHGLKARASSQSHVPSSARMPPAAYVRSPSIQLRDVSYSYHGRQPVLAGLSMDLEAGKATAIVGINGAGKTTLAKLITGLYLPDSGSVRVSHARLTGVEVDAWQQQTAVMFQDFVHYELSIRENVAMQAREAIYDDFGIRRALKSTGLLAVVDKLPRGLDTQISRFSVAGTELSGGQWQRLALARALFAARHKGGLLVLDEPTAQLDARGEAEFYANFLDITQGFTSLIISHRFSSVRKAHQIIVLKDGSVSERGTHEELCDRGDDYARMFLAQSGRFDSQ